MAGILKEHNSIHNAGFGQGGGPTIHVGDTRFGYAGNYSNSQDFSSPQDSGHTQDRILSGQDSATMSGFFNNPDNGSIGQHQQPQEMDAFDFLNVSGHGYPNGNYEHQPKNGMFDPIATMSSPLPSNYQTHDGTYGGGNFGAGLGFFGQASETIGQTTGFGNSSNNAALMTLAQLALPATDGQSINFHANDDGVWDGLSLDQTQHQYTPLPEVEAASTLRHLSGAQAVGNNQQMLAVGGFPGLDGLSHARSQSMHAIHTTAGLPNAYAQSHTSSPIRRPQLFPFTPRFGSDPNMHGGDFGYRVPGGAELQQQKECNLMQIPLAAQASQAAANGQGFSPPQHMLAKGQRTLQRSSIPDSQNNRDNYNVSEYRYPPSLTNSQSHKATHWGTLTQGHADRGPTANGTLSDSPPRKRRRSQAHDNDDDDYQPTQPSTRGKFTKRDSKMAKDNLEDEDDDDSDSQSAASKGTPKTRRVAHQLRASSGSSPSTPMTLYLPTNGEASQRRRGSARSRTNLTEEEKRQNHIKSEQKRRVVIKKGYEELERLVPTLRGGKSGLSKAEQIRETVAFIRLMMKSNTAMDKQVKVWKKDNPDADDFGASGSLGMAAPSGGYGNGGLLKTPSGLAILEIQGTVNSELAASQHSTDNSLPLGKLEFPLYDPASTALEDTAWQKRVYLYVGKHQRMTGEVKKLGRPIAVVRKRETGLEGEEELEVAEIVYWKVLFASRPEPVGSTVRET
ncbi:hypothetical protein LTR62_004554 [Meristemomyces frigidus]|uniref:BHLH domain-containing protein n=1 Tax=Meristemomyces frigidus TaxID=1508187 RepID=A0AAN7TQN9_9PEZI|nr:hypothetical protein LTR62_004554 [Meristemomyces frigidus]